MARTVNPTMKMFVQRLEQMCDRAEGHYCREYCPAHSKFNFEKFPYSQHYTGAAPLVLTDITNPEFRQGPWCQLCREFMGVCCSCPCTQYGSKAIPEARRRIAAWRKAQEQEVKK